MGRLDELSLGLELTQRDHKGVSAAAICGAAGGEWAMSWESVSNLGAL